MKKYNTSKDIELFAFRKLSVQEWTYFLLKRKIVERTDKPELIDDVLGKLVEDNWLSDDRFAECYTRSTRDNKGYGPMKVRGRLKEKGISTTIIEKYLFEDHPIWDRNCFNIRLRKYGSLPSSIKEKHKQSVFLQGRGFTFSQIKKSFSPAFLEYWNEITPPEDDIDLISLETIKILMD